MELNVKRVPNEEPEVLEIRCHKVTDDIEEIISFVKSRQGQLSTMQEGQRVEILLVDIFYAESVDNRLFVYTAKDNYEVRLKLYELEDMLRGKTFIRVQKGMLLNLMKIKSIKPALSGRYTALLKNGEQIVISRKYVLDLKSALKGEETR
ncbi:MAG: LytTR family transcriptional regulator DNA-binding domain-containing protein [Lachnospiraceae bacterium]|jgi:DNA-binding LytR/AlgR family response regulator|nr:LytTR family transcriptional regulator DNA-binding domain-containing protein [Lachnospiraceae bacterium]MCR4928790.1 LytTR family transcriptional regulator DNA-binding domain-containing protein [Lachnospiraceae bacterium]